MYSLTPSTGLCRNCGKSGLAVVAGNEAAEQLYTNSGFIVYGREEDALLVCGKFYAELFLALRL